MNDYVRFLVIKLWTLFVYAFAIGAPAFLIGGLVEDPFIAFPAAIGSSMLVIFWVIHEESEGSRKWLKRLIMRYRHFDFID